MGEHFSAGLDLAEVGPAVAAQGPGALSGDHGVDPFGVWGPPVSKPVVLAAQGIAYTLSIELALAADIVVAAVGVPHLVKADWIKPGAAVLDVGVTRVGTTESGRAKLAGDIDPGVASVAGWLSPNPGGVGPMTRALLVSNVVEAAERALA